MYVACSQYPFLEGWSPGSRQSPNVEKLRAYWSGESQDAGKCQMREFFQCLIDEDAIDATCLNGTMYERIIEQHLERHEKEGFEHVCKQAPGSVHWYLSPRTQTLFLSLRLNMGLGGYYTILFRCFSGEEEWCNHGGISREGGPVGVLSNSREPIDCSQFRELLKKQSISLEVTRRYPFTKREKDTFALSSGAYP